MSIREDVHEMVDKLPPEDLARAAAMMRMLMISRVPASEEERRARLTALRGSMPHLPSVDEFLEEKHAETERREAQLSGDQA
ncbi:MAG: hypothetical protein KKI08_11205 [Armatimonadetes bacterium]|nr:hypothetical protein [Armatimonadota bacterium]